MKKNVLRVVLCAVLVFAMMAIAACGGKKSTMQDYINSDDVQKELATLKTQVEAQGMSIDVTGEGNKLIYSYTISDTTVAEAEELGMAEALDAALQQQASTFTSLAGELKKVVDVDNPVVVVRYLASDGEIFTQEFTAE